LSEEDIAFFDLKGFAPVCFPDLDRFPPSGRCVTAKNGQLGDSLAAGDRFDATPPRLSNDVVFCYLVLALKPLLHSFDLLSFFLP